jgi:TetR/AcrR family transcriptional repressor of nem operon
MAGRGEATREKILDATQTLILEHGFSATSIDRVLEKTGMTRGAFFYHFKNKEALTRAIVERSARVEEGHIAEVLARAERMTGDPLQQLLVALGLLIESTEQVFRDADTANPGCLYGSYAYELDSVDRGGRDALRHTVLRWREMLRKKLDAIAERYPPRIDVNLDVLADNLLVAFEGGLILGRLLDDRSQTLEQLKLYRSQLELVFAPRPSGQAE